MIGNRDLAPETRLIAAHVAEALRAYRAVRLRAGHGVPAALADIEVLAATVARSRHESSGVDTPVEALTRLAYGQQSDTGMGFLLTRQQAATALSVSLRTLDRVSVADLPRVRVGRRCLFDPAAVQTYLMTRAS